MKHQFLTQIPDPDSTTFTRKIGEYFDGLHRAHLLMTAMELGVFDKLKEYRAGNEICTELGIEEMTGIMFLDALTDCGLLNKHGKKYADSNGSKNYLATDSKFCQSNGISMLVNNVCNWNNLTDILKNGQPVRKLSDIHASSNLKGRFNSGVGGVIGRMMSLIESQIDMKPLRSFLSIGAGGSLYAVAVSDKYPRIKSYVLDHERFSEMAPQILDSYDVGTEFRAGDYHKSLEGSYDMVFTSLTHASLEPEIAPIVSAGVNPGGYLVIRRNTEHTANDPIRDLDINLTRLDVIPKGVKHHHGDEDGKEYILNMAKNGLCLMNRIPFGPQTEVLIFKKI